MAQGVDPGELGAHLKNTLGCLALWVGLHNVVLPFLDVRSCMHWH